MLPFEQSWLLDNTTCVRLNPSLFGILKTLSGVRTNCVYARMHHCIPIR